jgi:hypothetical protein
VKQARKSLNKRKYIVKEGNRRQRRRKMLLYCICILNFHGLLGYLSAVVCLYKLCVYVVGGIMGGVGAKLVSFGTHKI